jgi:uncharacterized membrane protein
MAVRVGSRSAEVPFDWENQDTWAAALKGVGAAYASYYPDVAIPGAVEAVRSFAELAVKSGVKRLVLLSGRGEEEAQSAEREVQEVSDEASIERSDPTELGQPPVLETSGGCAYRSKSVPTTQTQGEPGMEAKLNKDRPANPGSARPSTLRSTVRALTLALATLTTGLIAGVFYAYSVSVNLGLAAQPDASYVATMNVITERIENPLFFANFLGAVVFLLAALGLYFRRPCSGRFWLVALACVLYIGGGFLLTMVVNVPMSYQLAAVDPDAPARVLAEARDAYEGPWNLWNGVRAVFTTLAFVALVGASLLRENLAPQGESSPAYEGRILR